MKIQAIQVNGRYSNWYSNKWYKHHCFSLIPILHTHKADEDNASGFNFRWLFLNIWSLDYFSFEIAFVIDTFHGIGITAILPYLRIKFIIPCPEKLEVWINKNLNRKPKIYETI